MVITYRNIESHESEIEKAGNKSKTTQQPNVRINPNLNKIKMEQDYNPIIIPKEEPLENNEVADEVQIQAMLSQVK